MRRATTRCDASRRPYARSARRARAPWTPPAFSCAATVRVASPRSAPVFHQSSRNEREGARLRPRISTHDVDQGIVDAQSGPCGRLDDRVAQFARAHGSHENLASFEEARKRRVRSAHSVIVGAQHHDNRRVRAGARRRCDQLVHEQISDARVTTSCEHLFELVDDDDLTGRVTGICRQGLFQRVDGVSTGCHDRRRPALALRQRSARQRRHHPGADQ